MLIRCEKLEMAEKSIRKVVHRMREGCTDAKRAESSFSDLTKTCQRIRSITMRKGQIFSVLLDRVSALQGRVCNGCIVRFPEAVLCDSIEFRVCNDFIQYALPKRYCMTV